VEQLAKWYVPIIPIVSYPHALSIPLLPTRQKSYFLRFLLSSRQPSPVHERHTRIPLTSLFLLPFSLFSGGGTDVDFLLSGNTLDWQDERPPAPSYLRVLYLGKILQDDDTLTRTYIWSRIFKGHHE
jgi:hypothetical protein